MNSKRFAVHGHNISGVFVFLLIGLFAMASITLVLTGANVYSRVTRTAEENTNRQLALSYLCNKVHAYDHDGGVKLDTRDGVQVLCLLENIDGEAYETEIYFYDGAICEQLSAVGDEFNPDLGERLTEVKTMEFTALSQNLIQVEVTLPDGSKQGMHMGLRSSQAR